MPTVKFNVQSDLESYFAKAKQQGNELATSMLDNAKKEAGSAKDTIKLIEDQIRLLERKNKIANDIAELSAKNSQSTALEQITNQRSELYSQFNTISRSKELSGNEKEDALDAVRVKIGQTYTNEDTVKNEYKEYSRKLQEESDQEKIQTKLAQEQLFETKDASDKYLKALKNGEKYDKLLANAKNASDKLAVELAKERHDKEKGDRENAGGDIRKLVGSIGGTAAILGLIGEAGKLTQTRSGYDIVGATEETKGKLIGTAIGTVVGVVVGSLVSGIGGFAGAGVGGAAGGQLGQGIAGLIGGIDQRIVTARMSYLDLENKLRSTTSGNLESVGMKDMSMYGLSMAEQLSSTREYARLSGSSKNAKLLAEESYFAEKGYGIDRSTTNALIENQRSTNRDDIQIANIVAGVLEKGKNTFFKNGDQTFLNEFLGKYSTLTKELLKNTNTVASGTTFDILSKFSALGGQFDLKDNRSMGLISTINSALSSGGGNDFTKAANFIALRQANPGMDLIDLLKEEQKGLGSSKYLSSVLRQIKGVGGGRSQQILNIANRLGLSSNFAAAESIYDNADDLINGRMSMKDIRTKGDLSGKAKEYTTPEQVATAELSNSLISTWSVAADKMVDVWKSAMENAFNGMRLIVNKDGTVSLQYDVDLSRQKRTLKQEQANKTANRIATYQRNARDYGGKGF